MDLGEKEADKLSEQSIITIKKRKNIKFHYKNSGIQLYVCPCKKDKKEWG